jgi:hypothetical protein
VLIPSLLHCFTRAPGTTRRVLRGVVCTCNGRSSRCNRSTKEKRKRGGGGEEEEEAEKEVGVGGARSLGPIAFVCSSRYLYQSCHLVPAYVSPLLKLLYSSKQ